MSAGWLRPVLTALLCVRASLATAGAGQREGLMADQIRHGLAQRVRGLLEHERWIGTGFYAHVRVTRVNDGTVRLRVRPPPGQAGSSRSGSRSPACLRREPAAGDPAELAGHCPGTV